MITVLMRDENGDVLSGYLFGSDAPIREPGLIGEAIPHVVVDDNHVVLGLDGPAAVTEIPNESFSLAYPILIGQSAAGGPAGPPSTGSLGHESLGRLVVPVAIGEF